MAGPLDDLRPVELLWILSEERKQFWIRGPALEATLAGFAARGMLEPEADGRGFRPTDAADDSDVDLRPYESALARRGLYREERRSTRLFGVVPWRETVRVPTDRYGAVVDELGEALVVDGAGVDVNVDSVSASMYPTERGPPHAGVGGGGADTAVGRGTG